MGNAPGDHQVCVQTTGVVCRTLSDSEPRYGIGGSYGDDRLSSLSLTSEP